MAMSFSRPDPSSPASIADASFGTSRRGFDQAEVKDFLRMVAAEFARLREREKFLERELQSVHASPDLRRAPVDEESMTRLLGEEAVRVLTTARESAAEIRGKAEHAAAQLLAEASSEAARVREEADIEASRRRTDAAADAEAELSMAKQQGREMVNEARAYRERVLGELARRRELAREQIEQLVHGRDRLLQAFERARLVAVDVVAELQPLGEPDEYVNLSPTTGPLPVMIANSARPDDSMSIVDAVPAAGSVSSPVADADDGAEPAAGNGLVTVPSIGLRIVHSTAGADDDTVDSTVDEGMLDAAADLVEGADVPDQLAAAETGAAEVAEPEVLEPEVLEPQDSGELDTADILDGDGLDDAGSDTETSDHAEAEPVVRVEAAPSGRVKDDVVVDLFARLRAGIEPSPDTHSQSAAVPVEAAASAALGDVALPAEAGSDTGVTPAESALHEPSPFEWRDEDLTPLIVSCARKLKRVLADEQNEVLDALRRSESVHQIDALLPWASEHVSRYASAIADDLGAAVQAGSAMSLDRGRSLPATHAADAVETASDVMAQWLVTPLRDRLANCITDGSGDNTEIAKKVRAVYREWKTRHIDESLDDIVRTAHGRGVLAGFVLDTPVVWEIDRRFPACADCDDNALAGAVAAGRPFPTGHVFAPAHPGCRCLLSAADR